MTNLFAGRVRKSVAAVLFAGLIAAPVGLALAGAAEDDDKPRRARRRDKGAQKGDQAAGEGARRGRARAGGPLAKLLADDKLEALFKKLDADTDGKLTAEEFKGLRDALEEAHKEAMRERRGQGAKRGQGEGKGRGGGRRRKGQQGEK